MSDKSDGKKAARRTRRRWVFWIAAAVIAFLAWSLITAPPRVEPGTVLVIDLRGEVPERAEEGFTSLLGAARLDFLEIARALDCAAADARIEGLLVRVAAGGPGPAQAEELAALLRTFRRAGKFVLAHAESPDTLAYLLAAAADEVLLDRSGTLDAVGLRLSAFFIKDGLDRLNVQADLIRVGDYKGTFEQFTRSAPTARFDEAMNALADSLYQTVVETVAWGRKLDEGSVKTLFDACPLTPSEALKERLADRITGGEEVRARLKEKAGKEVHLLDLADYLAACPAPASSGKWIAVIHLLGMIVDGESREVPLGGPTAGAETVAAALREAAQDPDVAAILLRIDSPGGSAPAAEKIYLAVEAARKRKPLVASLGDAAASGGYYAACAADKVIAQRMTLTGSIGIFGGKVVAGELLKRLGIEMRSYERGARAGMFDPTRPFREDERDALRAVLDDAYRRFVDRVATGRKKSFEEIQAAAEGRVWTGRAALDAGLVDSLGGLPEAVAALRELARVPPGTPLELRPHPPRATFWDLFRGRRRSPAARAVLSEEAALRAGADFLRSLGLLGGNARLALMPALIEVR